LPTPLMPAVQQRGCDLSTAFYFANRSGSLQFDIFVDADRNLGGVDVSCNANSEPVPNEPQIVESPFQVYGALINGF
jgi:hypothetical protein